MIDPNTETLISLSDAAKSLPRRRVGKRPHISCLYRWSTVGCRGAVLETIQVGGTRCTSREALARFLQQLTGRQPERIESPSHHARRREAEIVAAETELVQAGI